MRTAGCCSLSNEEEPVLIVGMDFSHSTLIGMNLDGIHLSAAWLEGADFSHASLKNAEVGCPVRAVFAGADLTGATVRGNVTGADFMHAGIGGLKLDC